MWYKLSYIKDDIRDLIPYKEGDYFKSPDNDVAVKIDHMGGYTSMNDGGISTMLLTAK